MHIKRMLSFLLAMLLLWSACLPGMAAEVKSKNPLLTATTLSYVRTSDELLNILLLGMDIRSRKFPTSGQKDSAMDSHTDVLMLISINLTQKKINLLSIPRDTLAYVPGVRGVYKINAAINTGHSVRDGLRRTTETVSWFLGGIKIDAYVALDLDALVKLVNVMGGIDFDLDMSFKGENDRYYTEGFQHLDGIGVADYVRARLKAGKERTDIGRTKRGRKMVTAVFDRIKSDHNMINELWAESQKSSINFFTNLNGIDVIADLWDFFQEVNSSEMGSYVFSGDYVGYALGYYNMNIIDQKERLRILKEVFGITAQELPYSSADYCSWLLNGGFQAVQKIRQAYLVMDYAQLVSSPSAALKKSLPALEKSYKAAVSAFDSASSKMRGKAVEEMNSAVNSLQRNAVTVAKDCGYPEELRWEKYSRWYTDPMINEYYEIDWR